MAKDSKNRRIVVRRLLQFTALFIMLLYYPIVMGFVADEYAAVTCVRIDSSVKGNDKDVLISGAELSKIVNRSFPDLSGMPIKDINLDAIEKSIERTPAVRKCECYTTPSGILKLEVEQRRPIMHVFTSDGSYYMDSEGFRIVAQGDVRAHAIIVNGNVGSMLDGVELAALCSYIDDDDFWKAQIEQIYVKSMNDFILVPRVGDHVVEFGGIDRMEEKFDLLYRLYTKGWKPKEWNLYKKVNLKYRGQVVCTRK
ncbi:MAG: hypothetical protein MJZ27_05805 [Bacteroidales bacterium]|nr:hypothetical protein [Bacteroidales bacterium]